MLLRIIMDLYMQDGDLPLTFCAPGTFACSARYDVCQIQVLRDWGSATCYLGFCEWVA